MQYLNIWGMLRVWGMQDSGMQELCLVSSVYSFLLLKTSFFWSFVKIVPTCISNNFKWEAEILFIITHWKTWKWNIPMYFNGYILRSLQAGKLHQVGGKIHPWRTSCSGHSIVSCFFDPQELFPPYATSSRQLSLPLKVIGHENEWGLHKGMKSQEAKCIITHSFILSFVS